MLPSDLNLVFNFQWRRGLIYRILPANALSTLNLKGGLMKARTKFFHGNEKGQTIIESVMCMLVIFLIFFGLLQIFYLSVAQMITDYSAFKSARSASVGFADYIVARAGRVGSLGAAGQWLNRSPNVSLGPSDSIIRDYNQGVRWINYEYWYSFNNSTNTDFGCLIERDMGGMVQATGQFNNYPINFPMSGAFTSSKDLDITANGKVMDSGVFFLE